MFQRHTVRSLTTCYKALVGAVRAERDAEVSEEERGALWATAAASIPNVELELEAEMYASPAAYTAIRNVLEDRAAILNVGIAGLMSDDAARREKGLTLIGIAAKAMLHAASRLASDVRVELSLKRVNREARLYDERLMQAGGNYAARFLALRSRLRRNVTPPASQGAASGDDSRPVPDNDRKST